MEPPIRLGLMAPQTGVVALYGPEIVRAARLACDAVNAEGGLLGRPLELIVEDDGSLPDTALVAARRLVDTHRCAALIGNLLSNARIAVADQVAEERRIPLLNFSFYEGSIRGRYFFHFAALPNQQISRMIPYMARHFGPKMFFAGNNYEWPRGSIDAAKRVLRQIYGDVVGEEYLPIGVEPAAIDALLGQVARSGADVFVPYFAGEDQIALLTRFTELGLKERMAVVMGHYDELMVSRLAPQVREGFYSSNTYFMTVETPENREVLRQLARHPGVDGLWPHGNGILTNFGEGAYLCVRAFAEAVRAAGGTEAEALVAALETVVVDGPQGRVAMDRATHHARVNTLLTRCTAEGVFTIVERFGAIAPEIPERYRGPAAPLLRESAPTPEVTARLAAEVGAVRRRLGAARRILSIADMAILATDADGVITEANRGVTQLFGYSETELVGMSVHQLLPPHFRERHAVLLRQFVTGEENERRMRGRNEITGYRKDGSFFPLEASIAKFAADGELLLVVTMRDISERKQAEEELTRRATHDALTGLPNRVLIRERLGSALQRSRRNGLSVALLFVDLDGFKLINDSHGHETGDRLLQAVSARLLAQVRPGDTVARLSGDEFVILCEQVEQPSAVSMLAERLNDALRLPFSCGGDPLFVTASIGVALGNGTTHAADDLLRQADTAMYAAKGRGRDGWQFFSQSLQEQAAQRLAISSGLRLAIERHELSTRFQPIVAADSGLILGAELLLRWRPESGEVSPGVFVPIAELTGAIVPIGEWVFREGCRAEADWRRRWGAAAPYVSINLSTRQLGEADLVDRLGAILAETGADPARLLLEITETALMADVEANLRVLRRLADLGLRVAVDDFGTGYSSLAQLSRLPVNVLKIDRAFIDGLDKSRENRAIIRAVISLGRALGLKLVAEGVETAAQHQELSAYGCDMMQGYHFHRPLERDAFVALCEQALLRGDRAGAPALGFVLYVSRATVPMDAAALAALHHEATLANRAAGISGCLVYDDGEFLQMIEGRQDLLDALMKRIAADPRHTDVRVVIQGEARQRVFVDWGMSFKALDVADGAPDFTPWQRRRIRLSDLAEDARAAYAYVTAHASGGRS